MRHHDVMRGGMMDRRALTPAMLALALAGCIPRGAPTDLPPAPGAAAEPDSVRHAATPTTRRTVSDGPTDLLADIDLRPPTPTAAWSARPVTTDARDVPGRTYVVQAGDTLRGIGNRTGAGSEALARANDLAPPYAIRAGQQLAIPAGRYHEVLEGQTGIAIARAYGVPWTAVIAENALEPPYVLRIGQRLRLPAGAPTGRALTMEEQAAAFHLDIDDIMTGGEPAAAPASVAPPRVAVAPTPAPAINGQFRWPVTGTIVQRFGPAALGRVNNGINIAAARGTPVRAASAGRVIYAGSDIGLFGGLILIEHDGGWVSAYGHLDRVAVRYGEPVAADAVIATVGDSGQVQSPQLHFELRRNRQAVDPLRHLPAR